MKAVSEDRTRNLTSCQIALPHNVQSESLSGKVGGGKGGLNSSRQCFVQSHDEWCSSLAEQGYTASLVSVRITLDMHARHQLCNAAALQLKRGGGINTTVYFAHS
jgi:hypothetical protein